MNSVGAKRKLKRNWLTALAVAVAFALVCVMLIMQIGETRKKNAELSARNERLEQQIDEQEKRQEELEDEEAYVKTDEFVEEKAKSIGYVYPDEIIYKRED